jgi:hypothetical protein
MYYTNDHFSFKKAISKVKSTVKKTLPKVIRTATSPTKLAMNISGAGIAYKGITGKDLIKDKSKLGGYLLEKTSKPRYIAAKTGLIVGGVVAGTKLAGTKVSVKNTGEGANLSGIKNLLGKVDLSKASGLLGNINLPKVSDGVKDLINKGLDSANPLIKQKAEDILKEKINEEIKYPTTSKIIGVPEIDENDLFSSKNLPYIIGGVLLVVITVILIAKK